MKDTNDHIESLLKQQQQELSAEEYAALIRIWETSPAALNRREFDAAAALNKVNAALAAAPIQAANPAEPTAAAPRKKTITLYQLIAAACLLACVAGVYYFYSYVHRGDRSIYAADGNRVIVLPDSTTITLRKGSTLTYPATTSEGDKYRNVALEGEAFFEVRHNADSPFRVLTSQVLVEDMGTSFTVKQTDTSCTVMVTTGKVRCNGRLSQIDSVTLSAGEQATLGQDFWVRSPGADPNFLSWKNHTLEFNQTPIDSVLSAVQELYAVRVMLAGDAGGKPAAGPREKDRGEQDQKRITARFNAGQRLQDVLEEIRQMTGLGMQQKKDTIIFYAR